MALVRDGMSIFVVRDWIATTLRGDPTLTALLGSGADSVQPHPVTDPTILPPYVTYAFLGGGVTAPAANRRIVMQQGPWLIRVWPHPTETLNSVRAAAGRLHALLETEPDGLALTSHTYDGMTVALTCHKEGFQIPEGADEAGSESSIGGQYRIMWQDTT